MRPIDRLLNDLSWQPLPPPKEDMTDGLPYATHAGALRFEGLELHVYQLNTGERVIESGDLERFFGVGPGEAGGAAGA